MEEALSEGLGDEAFALPMHRRAARQGHRADVVDSFEAVIRIDDTINNGAPALPVGPPPPSIFHVLKIGECRRVAIRCSGEGPLISQLMSSAASMGMRTIREH